MKLYFYYVKCVYGEEPRLMIEEHEAVEYMKVSYVPANKEDRFPIVSIVHKIQIGKIIGFIQDVVVLDKPDTEKAKEVLKAHFTKEHEKISRQVLYWERRLKALEMEGEKE